MKQDGEKKGEKREREANKRIQKAVKKAKEDSIGIQREEIEICPNRKQQEESITS